MRSPNLILVMMALSLSLFLQACSGGGDIGIGGTDTGPELTPEQPSSKAIDLFTQNDGSKDPNWLDTGSNNALYKTDLMGYLSDEQQSPYFTKAEVASEDLINFHSHYTAPGSHSWKNYRYSGKMMIDDPIGSIGVTFYSDYPFSNSYYRIRRYVRSTGPSDTDGFHFRPHKDDEDSPLNCMTESGGAGKSHSGIIPAANVWYAFSIEVTSNSLYTEIKARIWRDGNQAPTAPSIHCFDYSTSRFSGGTAGIWTGVYDAGRKYFKDFRVELL